MIAEPITAGQLYTLSFDLAGGIVAPNANSVEVKLGASVLNLNNLAFGLVFNTYSLSFTPTTTGTYTLSFLNSGGAAPGDNRGAYLDNVIITVPEPGTLAIAALALGALALSRRKVR